jgi:hypothetical protein
MYTFQLDANNNPNCTEGSIDWPITPLAAFGSAKYVGSTEMFGTKCDAWYIGEFGGQLYNQTSKLLKSICVCASSWRLCVAVAVGTRGCREWRSAGVHRSSMSPFIFLCRLLHSRNKHTSGYAPRLGRNQCDCAVHQPNVWHPI